MSRAFTKEPDGDVEELPERPPDPRPNYITPRGQRTLQARLRGLTADRAALIARAEDLSARSELRAIERELRHLRQRLEHAVVVQPLDRAPREVRFGATVTVVDGEGKTSELTVVGEDEACAATGAISWLSPLAQVLLGKAPGERVEWLRPAGSVDLEITSVSYGNSE